MITAAESAQRGYLLTGPDRLPGALSRRHAQLAQADRAAARADRGRCRSGRPTSLALEGLTAAAVSRLEQTIRSSPQPGPHGNADVAGTDRATQTMDRVRGVVDRMMSEEDARIEASRREVLRDMWVGAGVAVLATVVTVAVLIALEQAAAAIRARPRKRRARAARIESASERAGRAAHRRAHRAVAAPDPRVGGGKSQAGARAARHARQQSHGDQHGPELDPASPARRLRARCASGCSGCCRCWPTRSS